ncbi:unnamed protein product [Echinostoma caproni]|uniref:Ion_trans domain-containing protein n=1 Tax=Echinostoma caproni TaxID=27848 RepID=A0A183B978_9TREM|nr:unnamed protein product [Echinostoma caproni]
MHLASWISGLLTVLLIAASFAYSAPLLLSGTGTMSDTSSSWTLERASRVGDQFIMLALVGLTIFCDTHLPYWISVGSEFWLQIRLLVDNFIIIAGILITSDLFKESRRIRSNQSTKIK